MGEGLYLNPAIPEAADYVVKGVAELVQNYAVDGIHFDDYFIPRQMLRWTQPSSPPAARGI